MECMERTVVDFYVCLVVSVEAGEWHLEKKAVVRSRCLNFRRWAILSLRGDLQFPRFALGSKRCEITSYFPLGICLVCLFWPITHGKFTTDLLSVLVSPLGITKAPSLDTLALGLLNPHRALHLLSYFISYPPTYLYFSSLLFQSHSFPPTAAIPQGERSMCSPWRDTSPIHIKNTRPLKGEKNFFFSWTRFCLPGS